MKSTYQITYRIIDRGQYYSPSNRSIEVGQTGSMVTELKKAIKADKDTVKLTRNFNVDIINAVRCD